MRQNGAFKMCISLAALVTLVLVVVAEPHMKKLDQAAKDSGPLPDVGQPADASTSLSHRPLTCTLRRVVHACCFPQASTGT